jgi:spore coat protein U-like protein
MNKFGIFGSALLLAGSAFAAPQNDSEQITVSASVDVDAICELQYAGNYGPITGTLTPGMTYNAGPVSFNYGCNAPYTLSLSALNGQLQHSADNSIGIGYVLRFNGTDLGINPSSRDVNLDTVTDYASLIGNTKTGTGALELAVPGTNDVVAGTYEETVTVTLASNL